MVMNGTASHSTIRRLLSVWRLSGDCSPVYFLHMNTSSEERWNLVALLFTAMIIGIVVVGSLWIMYNLNINMMVD